MKNVIIYEDLMMIINLGEGNLSVVEAQNQKLEDGSTAYLLVFGFLSGLAKQIRYMSEEARNEGFKAIAQMIKNQSGQSPLGNNIIPVGLRPQNKFNGPIERR